MVYKDYLTGITKGLALSTRHNYHLVKGTHHRIDVGKELSVAPGAPNVSRRFNGSFVSGSLFIDKLSKGIVRWYIASWEVKTTSSDILGSPINSILLYINMTNNLVYGGKAYREGRKWIGLFLAVRG